jgi:hypothetical protein
MIKMLLETIDQILLNTLSPRTWVIPTSLPIPLFFPALAECMAHTAMMPIR